MAFQLPPGAFFLPQGACPAGYNKVHTGCFFNTGECAGVTSQYMCVPASASSAPQVIVSPNIQTQVSPQISPVFQQQYQPSNSPMTGGTQQTGASQTAPGGGLTAAEAQAMADKARAEEIARAKREQELAVREAIIAEREKVASAPPPVYSGGSGSVTSEGGGYAQAPAVQVPSVVSSGGGGVISYPSYGGSVVDTESVITEPVIAEQKPGIDWKIFAILGGLGLLAVSKRGR